MTKKERAALLARGEEYLARLERYFEESLQGDGFITSGRWQCYYSGAVTMMKELDLLSYEESAARNDAVFNRYLSTAFPVVPFGKDTTAP